MFFPPREKREKYVDAPGEVENLRRTVIRTGLDDW
jgi:hypothetical protein